jgi:putative ABC transport system permease protein
MALVGMTSLIRGFDHSLRAILREMGPDTIFVMKLSGASVLSGVDFKELLGRPNLTLEDARAVSKLAPSVKAVDVWIGGSLAQNFERISYRGEETTPMLIMGASDNFAEVSFAPLASGRFFTDSEVNHRQSLVVLGKNPADSLFPSSDAVGKKVRIGGEEYTVVGTLKERPNPARVDLRLDDIAVIPFTRYQAKYGIRNVVESASILRDVTIVAVPSRPELRSKAFHEVEEVMRIRHRLTLDKANDFDIVTQESALKIWEQLTRSTFFALVVISSIALIVGGIGVMAVMTIAVTERTREIGLRKALGSTNRQILWQFLIEAALLTSLGGVLGVLSGILVSLIIHFAYDFPVALSLSSFALGVGASAVVGVAFGTAPAMKAARVDPIVALHFE